jgi:hypothetical protein
MTAQPIEPDEPLAQVPARELRRLRALARIASPQELAEAEEAARIEELDALEASGRSADLSDQEARRILGVPAPRGDEKYLTTDEVRQRLLSSLGRHVRERLFEFTPADRRNARASRSDTSRFRLTCCSAASRTRRRWTSAGTRTTNLPE